MVTDAQRIPGALRADPPCKGCEERHTACWDRCPEYKAWKEESERIKKAKRAYDEEVRTGYEEFNRRNKWRRKTF